VEHYEISAYGTARCLARQIGEVDCARLLSHTLGEEESTDFLLSMISQPLLQQAWLNDAGASTDLDSVGGSTEKRTGANGKKATRTAQSSEEVVSRR
jgi:Mn-containing catalase